MKYLSVEKRCELIVDAYHSIHKKLEKPLLTETYSEQSDDTDTTNYGVLFRTNSHSSTYTTDKKTYKYEYKGKKNTFEDAISPYLDSLSDFKAGKKGTLIIFKNKLLLEHIEKYGKAILYDLVPNVTVVEYDFTEVVNSTSCYINCDPLLGSLSLDGQTVLGKGVFDMRENVSKESFVDLFYLFSTVNELITATRNGMEIRDWVAVAEEVARTCPNIEVILCCREFGGTKEYREVCGIYQWVASK